MSRAVHAAESFFFGLLQRELTARDELRTETELGELLRLSPVHEQPLTGAAGEAEGGTEIRFGLAQRLTQATVELDGETGEPCAWFLDFLAQGGTRDLPESEALALAIETAAPPEGARLERAGYETQGARVVYRARWSHEEQGLPVEGDFLEVLINGASRSPFALTRRWRTPRFADQDGAK